MRLKHLNVWFFALLLVVISLSDVVGPEIGFSALENRYLATRPTLSWNALMKGEFTVDFEDYVDDQFVMRDAWMRGKVFAEQALGKVENNGVVFGSSGYLFHKFIGLPERFHENVAIVTAFAQHNAHLPATFLMAPNSYSVLSENVPSGLYNVDQTSLIASSYEKLSLAGVTGVDALSALSLSGAEDLYYKLDHHWSTQGAYVAYTAWCASKGVVPAALDQWRAVSVPGFKGTFFSAAKRFDGDADEIVYYEMPHASVVIDGEARGGLYDLSFAEGKDKYGLFLYNNPGRLTIQSSYEGAKGAVIVFKDSYANSFLPFLTAHYETIEVIDLRYYNGKVSELVAGDVYDEMLFLYNVVTFSDDAFVRKLK